MSRGVNLYLYVTKLSIEKLRTRPRFGQFETRQRRDLGNHIVKVAKQNKQRKPSIVGPG